MITYNRLKSNVDYCFYDSSNVIFSKFMIQTEGSETGHLIVVFKGGRTYLYREVNVLDYSRFKYSESHGSSINTYIIKKYKAVRIEDRDLERVENFKKELQESDEKFLNNKVKDIKYEITMDKNLNFVLKNIDDNDKESIIYTGIENKVSIVQLLTSMGINFNLKTLDDELLNINNDNINDSENLIKK